MNTFVYGTQFYRPPNPPRAVRQAALEHIARELGFNTIKIWVMWNWCNPEPGQYDFGEVEEIMAACDKLGLRVVVNTILETAPYWLDEQYPEARYVNARLEALQLRGRSSDPSGGWPGLCCDHAPVRAAAVQFLTAVAAAVRGHPSLLAYDCWNEPHIEPAWFNSMWPAPEQLLFCYCPSSRARFIAWLQAKYSDLAALNEAWTRRYRHWDDVLPPQTHGTYADWLDWRRFAIDSVTEQMHFRVAALRAADPEHPIMSHAAKFPPLDAVAITTTNGWDLAEPLDLWGLAVFPKWHRMDPAILAGKLEACRSNAQGKPWWVAELQGGHGMVTGLQRGNHVYANDIRLWNWLAVAAGAKGVMYWTYLAEATGVEATGFGLVAQVGQTTERAQAAAHMAALLQQYADLVDRYEPVPQVAILYDQDNALLAFAMDGKEDSPTASAMGYYRAAWVSDVWVRFIQPLEIASLLPGITVLIVPSAFVGKPDTLAALQAFVEQGGVLVAETSLGLFDANGYHTPPAPAAPLHTAWAIQEHEAHWLPDTAQPATIWQRMGPLGVPMGARTAPLGDIERAPLIEFCAPITGTMTGHIFLTPLEVQAPAEVIAHCQGLPVAARVKCRAGTVYYFGTNLGAAIHFGEAVALQVVQAILAAHTQPVVRGRTLRPRLVEQGDEALLIVLNPEAEACQEILTMPAGYQAAVDVYTGQCHALAAGQLSAKVGAADVQVFHLHRSKPEANDATD